MKIGVFDSGIGGLSILKELYNQAPYLDYYYFSDSRFTPYGNKGEELIYERSKFITEVFLDLDITTIVVACNTATAWCIDRLRKEFPRLSFFGVEPYINIINKDKSLALKRGVSLVTELMSSSKRYNELKLRLDPKDKLMTIALPRLAYDIEINYFKNGDMFKLVESNLKKYQPSISERDFIVLGCTHYPIVRTQISSVLGLPCVSPCTQVAQYVLSSCHINDEKQGKSDINFFDSKDDNAWRVLKYEELILF